MVLRKYVSTWTTQWLQKLELLVPYYFEWKLWLECLDSQINHFHLKHFILFLESHNIFKLKSKEKVATNFKAQREG